MTRDAAADVKQNLATDRRIYNSRVSVYINPRGWRVLSLRAEKCPTAAGFALPRTAEGGRVSARKTRSFAMARHPFMHLSSGPLRHGPFPANCSFRYLISESARLWGPGYEEYKFARCDSIFTRQRWSNNCSRFCGSSNDGTRNDFCLHGLALILVAVERPAIIKIGTVAGREVMPLSRTAFRFAETLSRAERKRKIP